MTDTHEHRPQVIDLPAGTRYVIVPPERLTPWEMARIRTVIDSSTDARVLVTSEPGWTVYAIPEPAP